VTTDHRAELLDCLDRAKAAYSDNMIASGDGLLRLGDRYALALKLAGHCPDPDAHQAEPLLDAGLRERLIGSLDLDDDADDEQIADAAESLASRHDGALREAVRSRRELATERVAREADQAEREQWRRTATERRGRIELLRAELAEARAARPAPTRPAGDDPYDHPGHSLVKRIIAIAADVDPSQVDPTDGSYEQITGLLSDDAWQVTVELADALGLEGDWQVDDVSVAVADELASYRERKTARPAPIWPEVVAAIEAAEGFTKARREPSTDRYIEAVGALVEAVRALPEDWRDGAAPALDADHFARQIAFSERTFGPGPRTAPILDHIRKELDEVAENPADLGEWVDVMILAADGAWRAGHQPQAIIDAVIGKQARNEARTWPDWRTAEPGKAIEHDRADEAAPAAVPAVLDEAAIERAARVAAKQRGVDGKTYDSLPDFTKAAGIERAREVVRAYLGDTDTGSED
jgi:hypothetical protein